MALKTKIKVKTSKVQQVKSDYYHFGYDLVSETAMGNKTSLIFIKSFPLSALKKLEKQYIKVNKKFPLAATIILLIALLFLLLGLFLNINNLSILNVIFYCLSGFMFDFSLFLYIGFCLIKIYKKKIIAKIFIQTNKINPNGFSQLPITNNTINN